jgi:4-amino-4-deoxy-L-arabinose transferase-like glycosyltransferase
MKLRGSTISSPRVISPLPGLSKSKLLSTVLATLVACVVLLPLLGHKPLAVWDEGIYAEISREALSSGWLVLHWNRQLWMEKPPLLIWVTAFFFKLFGISEFSARIGSALSGVAIVSLLHAWLLKRKTALAAWLNTLILLGTFGFLRACRFGETDVLLSLGCMVALIGLAQVDRSDPRGWYLFWIGFAVALMTKGAASLILPVTALLFGLVQRWKSEWGSRACWIGWLLFLLLILPWHLMMFHLFGDRFWSEYFGMHVWTRATRQIEGHTSSWWYYLKVVIVSAPPFVLLYPIAIANSFRDKRWRVWAVFSIVVFTLFTIAQTRLPHYITPVYPSLTVLTAIYLDDRIRPYLAAKRPASFWIRWTVTGVAVFVGTVFLTRTGRSGLHTLKLPNGVIVRENQDEIDLLRNVFGHPQPIDGPLLVWHVDRTPMTTEVYYSRRPVQQVQLLPVPEGVPIDRYIFNPEPLNKVVQYQPRLILLDKSLVRDIPAEFIYAPIESGRTVELGSLARR